MEALLGKLSVVPHQSNYNEQVDAFTAAQTEAARHDGWQAFTGMGESMAPYFTPGTALVVRPVRSEDLQVGMVVVYMGPSGTMRAHLLVKPTDKGWVAMGCHNKTPDDGYVTDDTLVGVVTAAYTPAAAPERRDIAERYLALDATFKQSLVAKKSGGLLAML
jgi:signal peptidase I